VRDIVEAYEKENPLNPPKGDFEKTA